MHIPDGFVSGSINAAGFAVSAVAIGVALRKATRTLDERQVPLLGVTSAFVFAAQMVNFPVAAGTSGHFLGAALSAVLLGPWNACLVMGLVLTLQCLLFADGGLTALGSNTMNMGVVGVFGAYGVFRLVSGLLPKTRWGFLTAVAVASWSSVVLAATACAFELAGSGTVPAGLAVPAMAGVHAVIGVGEAVVTVGALSVVLAARPELVAAANGWPVCPPGEART